MVDMMARPCSQWAHESRKESIPHPFSNTNNIPEQRRPHRPEAAFTNPPQQIASHRPSYPHLPQPSTSHLSRRTSAQSSHVSSPSLDSSPSVYWDPPQAYEPPQDTYTGTQSRSSQPSPTVFEGADTYQTHQFRETAPTYYATPTDRPWHRITAPQPFPSLSSIFNGYSFRPPSPSPGPTPPRESESNTATRSCMSSPRQTPRDAMAVQALLNSDSTSNSASGKAAVRKMCADAVRHRLVWRQKPLRARNCGCGDKDRRAVDPPPILELKVDGPGVSAEECLKRSMAPQSIVMCSIWSEDGGTEVLSKPSGPPRLRQLIGNLVAFAFPGHDEHGREGCFFVFPDLSVRDTGFYRLKFSLVALDSRQGSQSPVMVEVMSDVIQVWPAKGFPGMLKSSALVMALKEQGCSIPAKKGNDNDDNGGNAEEANDNEVSGVVRESIESSEDEDEEDDDGDGEDDDKSPRKRAKLKQ